MPDNVTLQVVTSAVTFLAGALLGHWLAIGRERRSAFHDICQKMREELLKFRSGGIFGYADISAVDADLYCRLASRRRRRRFQRALEQFKEARKAAHRRDSMGGEYFQPTPELRGCYEALLRLTEWP